ncbi:hypothetical protein Tco_1089907 [Tanacetum coccineum]|uniref:Uncharacterized protein n=1 Tax=Tanacetum coccineum TaxID=301880 RepID=A0ABQ5I2R0_9ASTR
MVVRTLNVEKDQFRPTNDDEEILGPKLVSNKKTLECGETNISLPLRHILTHLEQELKQTRPQVHLHNLGRLNFMASNLSRAGQFTVSDTQFATMLLKSFDTEQYIIFPVMSQLYKDDLILFQIERFGAGLERNLPRQPFSTQSTVAARHMSVIRGYSDIIKGCLHISTLLLGAVWMASYLWPLLAVIRGRLFGWRIIRGLAMFLWLAVIAAKTHDLALEMRKWEVQTPVSTDMLGRIFNGFGNRSIRAKAYQGQTCSQSCQQEVRYSQEVKEEDRGDVQRSLQDEVNPDDIELGGWDISSMNLADAIAGAMALDIMRFMSSSICIQKPTV